MKINKLSAITALALGGLVACSTMAVAQDQKPGGGKRGQSVRLRISETYTDPARYRTEGELLIWDRSFGRPANAVVLPAGWMLTHSSVPGAVSLTQDGRVRLDFVNPRPDEIQVLIVARRR